VTMVSYSEALKACKGGAKISRMGWNGTNMYVVHQAGYPDGIPINANTARATGIEEGTVCAFLPYLMMRVASSSLTPTFVPWTASQTDMIQDDWVIADEKERAREDLVIADHVAPEDDEPPY
jgi:hypothetical protein